MRAGGADGTARSGPGGVLLAPAGTGLPDTRNRIPGIRNREHETRSLIPGF